MTRVVSGVALAAAFFAIVWYTNTTVLLFVALTVGTLALHEYIELVRQIGADVPRVPTFVVTLAAIAVVPFPYVAGEAVLGIGLAIIAAAAMFRIDATGATTVALAAQAGPSGLARTLLGIVAGAFAALYIGLALGSAVGVHIFGGRGGVVLLVATVALSDTAQYYSGRMFGRHPLAPRLSPKKTIEGALGGFIIAPLFLFFAGPYFVPPANPVTLALLGVVLVAAGIAGDLFESMIKRAADLKDSSALIPGHGGVLDRIDALLFAAPVFYMYLRWVYTA